MKIKILLFLLTISALISLSFKNNTQKKFHPLYSFGAAVATGFGYTGAPFDNGGASCSNCHGGGSFAPTVSLKMINSSNNSVTTYTAGENYTIRLSIIATTGTPKYGFQLMSAKASDNTNLNNWGAALPTEVKNTLTAGGRNYIEHNSRLTNGIIDIPWTAPITATGDINFYAVGNAVDGTGSIGGDNALTTNLSVTAAPVPITLLSFTGKAENDAVQLQWQTAQEINNDYFIVEHSIDGINFSKTVKLLSKGNTSIGNIYSYSDKQAVQGINFYRLKQVDVDGSYTYSNIVLVKNNAKKIAILVNPVANEIVLTNVNIESKCSYKIVNVAGKIIANAVLISNKINVSKLISGNYFLQIVDKNNSITTIKFVKE
jgi:Secretion system C-terminal sorting domain/Reeler domain